MTTGAWLISRRIRCSLPDSAGASAAPTGGGSASGPPILASPCDTSAGGTVAGCSEGLVVPCSCWLESGVPRVLEADGTGRESRHPLSARLRMLAIKQKFRDIKTPADTGWVVHSQSRSLAPAFRAQSPESPEASGPERTKQHQEQDQGPDPAAQHYGSLRSARPTACERPNAPRNSNASVRTSQSAPTSRASRGVSGAI